MVVEALGKLKNNEAIPVLIKLLKDNDVQGHAVMILSKFNDPSLIPHINLLVSHNVSWIRNAEKKAIKKLKKREADEANGTIVQ